MAEHMESQVNHSTKLNATAPNFVPRTIVDGSNHATSQAEGARNASQNQSYTSQLAGHTIQYDPTKPVGPQLAAAKLLRREQARTKQLARLGALYDPSKPFDPQLATANTANTTIQQREIQKPPPRKEEG